MPSVQSLQQQQYYGNRQNHFWRLLFALWHLTPPDDYTQRCAFVVQKRIALWDVLESCDRQGSMDHAIRNARANDIPALLCRQPGIRAVFFNSKNAERFFQTLVAPRLPAQVFARPLEFTTLPSSSPARAMAFEEKLRQWQVVRSTLERLEKEEHSPGNRPIPQQPACFGNVSGCQKEGSP